MMLLIQPHYMYTNYLQRLPEEAGFLRGLPMQSYALSENDNLISDFMVSESKRPCRRKRSGDNDLPLTDCISIIKVSIQ